MMRAILLQSPNKFRLKQVPIPKPSKGEVLIHMEAAPINPSDIICLRGRVENQYPLIPGFEGSGTVIESGGGFLGWNLKGKRVACFTEVGQGTWSEYVVTSAKKCIQLPTDISFEQGACSFTNPIAAVTIMDVIKENGHKAIIQTAAASSLGKMILRSCIKENIPVINVVRRDEQVRVLKEIGAKYILNSSQRNFEIELKKLIDGLNATAAFDCVAGEMTGNLVNLLGKNSVVYVYGMLSQEKITEIDPAELIFNKKKIEGLWTQEILKRKGAYNMLKVLKNVVKELSGTLKTDIANEFDLGEIDAALYYYNNNPSAGKILLKPKITLGQNKNT